jgi:hypothetical protein
MTRAVAVLRPNRVSTLRRVIDRDDAALLPDGTAMLVVQVRGVRKCEVVAHVLAISTRIKPWVDEHDDSRGVPYVLSRDIERLAQAQTYEQALDLADEVTFVRPQRREDQVKERKRRLRRALALGEG